MCVRPIQTSEGPAACGKCGECIRVEKWDWVSRGVAETLTMPWGGTISLTYDESDRSHDGKKTFIYDHVRTLITNLRTDDQGGQRLPVRFLVAGERGSQRGRVHWHCIFWSTSALWKLGRWADFQKQYDAGFLPSVGPLEQFRCEPVDRKRLVWSKWPYGHVYLDDASQDSIEYVLKYTQKGRFNAKAAQGQKHEAKVEVSSAALFRMSKIPPIGGVFLQRQIASWKQRCVVPPSGQVTVPGLDGTWYPRKTMRERLLDGFAEVYRHALDVKKRPPAGWEALVANWESTETGRKTLDRLWYKIELPSLIEDQRKELSVEEKERQAAEVWKQAEKRAEIYRCGGFSPCDTCRAGLAHDAARSSEQYAYKGAKAYHQARAKARADGKPFPSPQRYHWDRRGQNPWCRRLGPTARTRTRSPSRRPA